MATFNEESMAFLEEIRKYDCLYNRFNKDFKNKFQKYNCWIKVGEKYDMTPEDCEKKFRNLRTSYGRMLRKRKAIPSGSGRETATTDESFKLDWLSNTIVHRKTVTNFSLEDDTIMNESVEDAVEEELDHVVGQQSQNDEVDTEDQSLTAVPDTEQDRNQGEREPIKNGVVDNSKTKLEIENTNKGNESKQSLSTKQKRPVVKAQSSSADSLLQKKSWAAVKSKPSKLEIDVALMQSAKKISEVSQVIKERNPANADYGVNDDEDSLFCRSLVQRMRRLSQHGKAFVRYQIEQTFYQAEVGSQQVQTFQRFGSPSGSQPPTHQSINPLQIHTSFPSYRGLLEYGSTPTGSSNDDFSDSSIASSAMQ